MAWISPVGRMYIYVCSTACSRLKLGFLPGVAVESGGAKRAKFNEKVHKPPLKINVINFELNGFNVSLRPPKNVMHLYKYSNS